MNFRRLICMTVAAASSTSAYAQSNVIWPNDDCDYATPSGDGAYGFDTGSPFVTTSLPPLPATCPGCTCGPEFIGIENDVWFLWTATCTGVVEMKTGLTPPCNLDTVLAVYSLPCPPATATPVTPLVCCDDSCAAGGTCDLASFVQLDVVCGEQYLVRVGMKPGTPGDVWTLTIECLGEECPPPPTEVCEDCCGAKPHFDGPPGSVNSIYSTHFTGQVAVVTASNGSPPFVDPNLQVLTIFNLDHPS